MRFEGNSILPKSSKLDFFPRNWFFPSNLIFGHFAHILNFMMDFRKNLSWVTLLCNFYQQIFLKRQKYAVKHKSRKSFQKGRNLSSKIMKIIFKRLKLVFKKLKLVFKASNSLVPHFPCKEFNGFRTKKPDVQKRVCHIVSHVPKTHIIKITIGIQWFVIVLILFTAR